jgi:hypothetical protein
MMDPEYSPYGAWLITGIEKETRWYRVGGIKRDGEASTGGWAALEEAESRPQLDPAPSWEEEAITGITPGGKQSKIKRAALSGSHRGGGRKATPEEAAARASHKWTVIPSNDLDDNFHPITKTFKRCPKCNTPRPPEAWSKGAAWCRDCERIRLRRYRMQRRQQTT